MPLIAAVLLPGDLAALDSGSGLRLRLRRCAAPDLVLIDEVGCLSYSDRHADLMFELGIRRYQHKSTVVNASRPFASWSEVFPNAACVVSLVCFWYIAARSCASRASRTAGRKSRSASRRVDVSARSLLHPLRASPSHEPPPPAARNDRLGAAWDARTGAGWPASKCLSAMREALWELCGPQAQQTWLDQLRPEHEMPEFDPNDPL